MRGHNYFSDKVDLICCGVRHYKAKRVTRYDQITSAAQSRDELSKGSLQKLGETVRDESQDTSPLVSTFGSQPLFEEAFRNDVAEIEKSLEDMVRCIASRFRRIRWSTACRLRGVFYALFDGRFQRCPLRHLSGDRKAIDDLQEEVGRLPSTVA